MTFAYLARFWFGVFAGRRRIAAGRVPPLLVAPDRHPRRHLAGRRELRRAIRAPGRERRRGDRRAADRRDPAYHLDARVENLMALAAWALGALILVGPAVRIPITAAIGRAGDRIRSSAGVQRCCCSGSTGCRMLPTVRKCATFGPASSRSWSRPRILTALGFAVTPTEGAYVAGSVSVTDLPLVVLLGLAVIAALTAARDRGRLRPVLALSVLGFSLAGVYAVMGAPDVALVAVVIETVLTLVFVGVFSRLPGATVGGLERCIAGTPPAAQHRRRDRRRRQRLCRHLGRAFAPAARSQRCGRAHPLTPEAHGGDVVTVILADFRGLDTMVEMTVLAVAIIGSRACFGERTRA